MAAITAAKKRRLRRRVSRGGLGVGLTGAPGGFGGEDGLANHGNPVSLLLPHGAFVGPPTWMIPCPHRHPFPGCCLPTPTAFPAPATAASWRPWPSASISPAGPHRPPPR